MFWSTLRTAYARLGFGPLDDAVFEQVMLARLVEPTSKLDTIRLLEGLGVRPRITRPSIDTSAKPRTSAIASRSRRSSSSMPSPAETSPWFSHDLTTLYFAGSIAGSSQLRG